MRQNDPSDAPLDILSHAARNVLRLHATSAYQDLVPSKAGPVDARAILEAIEPANILSHFVANRDDAAAMLAGLWLWHDFLPESHHVSQALHTPNGALWHAIMHRREGDFSNSKYWLSHCQNHPIFATLAIRADDAIRPYPADKGIFRLTNQGWNASAFVDLVAEVRDSEEDPRHGLAVSLQQLEWRLLFDHCTRGAAG